MGDHQKRSPFLMLQNALGRFLPALFVQALKRFIHQKGIAGEGQGPPQGPAPPLSAAEGGRVVGEILRKAQLFSDLPGQSRGTAHKA